MLHPIKWMKKKLKKLFLSLFGKKKGACYIQPIIDAASGKGYVESYSNKADSLHLDIKKKLYEEDLQSSFLSSMNALAKYFRKGKVRLAIDFQEEGFYGKTISPYIIGTNYKHKSYSNGFMFLTISLLIGRKEERIPLYALSWHIGQDIVESIAILLSAVRIWLGKIEVVQFDRGFYILELIHFLTENRIPYLIHVPKQRGYLSNLVKETKSFYSGKNRRKFYMNKTTYWAEMYLYVCKDVKKKDWLFASSIWFENKYQPVNLYRNRWQIETNYAVHNSARLMSKSTDYIVRYFYYLIDIILQVLWRLCACKIPLRTFLFSMVVGIRKMKERKPCFAET